MSLKSLTLALVGLAVLLVLAACKGDGGGGKATTTPGASTPSATSPAPALCPKIDDKVVQAVVAVLELDKTSYKQGQPIEVTLRLINCASQPITRTFPDAQRYDFAAKLQDGDEVWRWSADMTFDQKKGEETYESGKQLTFHETWDQLNNDGKQVQPGQYEISTESTGCDEGLQNCGPKAVRFVEITAP